MARASEVHFKFRCYLMWGQAHFTNSAGRQRQTENGNGGKGARGKGANTGLIEFVMMGDHRPYSKLPNSVITPKIGWGSSLTSSSSSDFSADSYILEPGGATYPRFVQEAHNIGKPVLGVVATGLFACAVLKGWVYLRASWLSLRLTPIPCRYLPLDSYSIH